MTMHAAVIVTFNSADSIQSTIRSASRLFDMIVVVDNASNDRTKDIVEANLPTTGTIISNSTNKGIAAALNIGIDEAGRMGAEWVTTLDADSEFFHNSLNILQSVAHTFEIHESKALALFVPSVHESFQGNVKNPSSSEKRWDIRNYSIVDRAITSGMTFRFDVYEKIGGMREDFFIDAVDDEYCLRAARYGIDTVLVQDAILLHAIGSRTTHAVLGRRMLPTHHSPLRRYYMARNGLYLWKRYAFRRPHWFLNNHIRFWFNMIKVVLFESDKQAKVWATMIGLVDGLVEKMGKSAHSF